MSAEVDWINIFMGGRGTRLSRGRRKESDLDCQTSVHYDDGNEKVQGEERSRFPDVSSSLF